MFGCVDLYLFEYLNVTQEKKKSYLLILFNTLPLKFTGFSPSMLSVKLPCKS